MQRSPGVHSPGSVIHPPPVRLQNLDVLLQILATLTITATVLVVMVVWFYWTRIKRWCGSARVHDILHLPARLTLGRRVGLKPAKLDRTEPRMAAFREMGFEELGAFAVENAPGGRLFAFTHPGTGLIGTVEERDCAGTWSDVLLPEPNDEFVMASNAHSHFHFFFLPGDRKVHKPRATERELVQAALEARSPNAISQPMTAERFVAICEKAYARHMDRLLLEGLADCDLRRLLKARNSEHAEDFSEEEFIWLKEGLREATENLLRAACAVEWMRAASPPAFACQQARGRLLVIHDRTALRLLRRRRICEAFLTRNKKHLLDQRPRSSETPRATFARLNASLPARDRYKKLGEVTQPLPADIYQAPLVGQST